jgi:hypothetical protein
MSTRLRIVSAAILASSVSLTPALAWDGFGHMEVAAIAWEQMLPQVQARAIALLKLNPMFEEFIAGVPPDKRDKFAFMRAATWPDLIKQDATYHNDGTENGDVPPDTPEASLNIGYTDKARHKYWHFIDAALPPSQAKKHPAPNPNVKTRIAAFRATLPSSSSASDEVRSYDMVWLEHLVGDAHQPLHAVTRFSPGLPDGDHGGNFVKIHCGTAKNCGASELHAFWDDLLGPNSATPEEVETAAKALPKAPAAGTAITDEAVWLNESFKAAQSNAYVSPIRNGPGPFALTAAYQTKATNLAKQRIALAGARLARLLNAAFK